MDVRCWFSWHFLRENAAWSKLPLYFAFSRWWLLFPCSHHLPSPASVLSLKALPSVLCCCAQTVFNIDPREALLLFSFLFASLKGLAKWIKINEQKYSLSGLLAVFAWHVTKCGRLWRFVSWWLFLPFPASTLPNIVIAQFGNILPWIFFPQKGFLTLSWSPGCSIACAIYHLVNVLNIGLLYLEFLR